MIEVFAKNARALVRLEDVANRKKAVFAELTAAGISLILTQSQNRFFQLVEQISEWESIDIADARGFHGRYFLLAKDCVALGMFARAPHILLNNNSAKWEAKGSVSEWQRVARLLEGQPLPIFCACVAFASPLATLLGSFGNIIIEVTGEEDAGIAAICKWIGSIWGGDTSRVSSFVES